MVSSFYLEGLSYVPVKLCFKTGLNLMIVWVKLWVDGGLDALNYSFLEELVPCSLAKERLP